VDRLQRRKDATQRTGKRVDGVGRGIFEKEKRFIL